MANISMHPDADLSAIVLSILGLISLLFDLLHPAVLRKLTPFFRVLLPALWGTLPGAILYSLAIMLHMHQTLEVHLFLPSMISAGGGLGIITGLYVLQNDAPTYTRARKHSDQSAPHLEIGFYLQRVFQSGTQINRILTIAGRALIGIVIGIIIPCIVEFLIGFDYNNTLVIIGIIVPLASISSVSWESTDVTNNFAPFSFPTLAIIGALIGLIDRGSDILITYLTGITLSTQAMIGSIALSMSIFAIGGWIFGLLWLICRRFLKVNQYALERHARQICSLLLGASTGAILSYTLLQFFPTFSRSLLAVIVALNILFWLMLTFINDYEYSLQSRDFFSPFYATTTTIFIVLIVTIYFALTTLVDAFFEVTTTSISQQANQSALIITVIVLAVPLAITIGGLIYTSFYWMFEAKSFQELQLWNPVVHATSHQPIHRLAWIGVGLMMLAVVIQGIHILRVPSTL
jgi:uncharacterized membrane protein